MILSIESSCDDSSIAITEIESLRLALHQKISQDAEHSPHGGVVPEIASRLHAVALPRVLAACSSFLPRVSAVAVTHTPGFAITLLEGIAMAHALCLCLRVPLIAAHHLKGHIYSLFLEKPALFPLDVLLVSGGHTLLLHAHCHEKCEIVAASLDDSFGESFDKVAKMLGLGYPGGAIVESLAQKGDDTRFAFTIPLAHHPNIAFSFSGLKNSVRLAIANLPQPLSEQDKADICASFQRVAVAHLLQQVARFLRQSQYARFGLVGGASANLLLRESLQNLLRQNGKELLLAPLPFCSDNAAMIGRLGVQSYLLREFHPLALGAVARTEQVF